MPPPEAEQKVEETTDKQKPKHKPSKLAPPDKDSGDESSSGGTPSPKPSVRGAGSQSTRSFKSHESPARTHKAPKLKGRSKSCSDSKSEATDDGIKHNSKEGQPKGGKKGEQKPSDSSGVSRRGSTRHKGSPGSQRKSVRSSDSPRLKRQVSKSKGTNSPSSRAKSSSGGKGSESPGYKRSKSQDIPKTEDADSPKSPRRSGDGARKYPESPLTDSPKSKHEQLKQRHLGRRSLHDTGHKQLVKQESLALTRKSSGGSDDDKSHHNEHSPNLPHHKSPKRSMSERRRSTRTRTGPGFEHRRSSTIGGCTNVPGRRASVRRGSIIIPITDRRLSIDHLSITDITAKTNGSTLHIEYPYKESVDHRPYMSPGLSSAYQKPGAEILIASLIIIVGLVFMITSFATGKRVWMVVGGVCLGLGGSFMVLGLCWHCARQRQKQEEEDREMNVLTSKQLIKLAERSPSICSQKVPQVV